MAQARQNRVHNRGDPCDFDSQASGYSTKSAPSIASGVRQCGGAGVLLESLP